MLYILITGRITQKFQNNRIHHRSLMQTEKSQLEGLGIIPETRVTEFPALSVDPRVGISRSASETDISLLFYLSH